MAKKILVVDDEPDMCEMLKDFLESLGYPVLSATTGQDGIVLVERENPNLVFLDMMMPDMTGLACLEKIKKGKYPETVVVMLTGLLDEGIAKKAIECGAYDYLTKPLDFNHIENNLLARLFPA